MFIYRDCAADTVPYNTSFIIIHFNWNDSIEEDTRCYCAMALLNLTISTDVLTAGICKGNNKSKINCENICEDNNNKTLICGVSNDHYCNIETKKCLLYGHEQYKPKQSYLLQAFVAIHGIPCDVIGNQAEETCRELIITRNIITPTPTDDIGKCGHSKEGSSCIPYKVQYSCTSYNIAILFFTSN